MDVPGTWMTIFILILGLFLHFGCGGQKVYKPDTTRESLHPLLSLMNHKSKFYPTYKRGYLMLCTIVVQGFVEILMFSKFHDEDEVEALIVLEYAFFGIVVSWFTNYFFGLGVYQSSQHAKAKQIIKNNLNPMRNCCDLVFICGSILLICCTSVIFSSEMAENEKMPTVIAFFLGLVLDFLIFDTIVATLGKSIDCFFSIVKKRGFYCRPVDWETVEQKEGYVLDKNGDRYRMNELELVEKKKRRGKDYGKKGKKGKSGKKNRTPGQKTPTPGVDVEE